MSEKKFRVESVLSNNHMNRIKLGMSSLLNFMTTTLFAVTLG